MAYGDNSVSLDTDTGSAWKTDGSVVGASDTNLQYVEANDWTFATAPGTTPDGDSVAIQATTEGRSRVDLATIAEIDDALDFNSREYWQEFYLRFIEDGTFAETTVPILKFIDFNTTGLRAIATYRFDLRAAGDPPETRDGVRCYIDHITGASGAKYNLAESIQAFALSQYADTKLMFEGTNPGRMAMFGNGVLLGESYGDDWATAIDDASTTIADYRLDAYLSTAAAPDNLTLQIAPPVHSYGRERPSRVTPRWDLEPSANNSVYKYLFHHPRLTTSADHGRHWYYTDSGGASTVMTAYSSDSFPMEYRPVTTFSSSGSLTATSCDSIGALPYRTSDGWCTVVLRDYLHVSGANLTLNIRDTADTTTLVQLQVDSSNNLNVGDPLMGLNDTGIDLTASRWMLVLALHENGGCRVMAVDNSAAGDSQYVWSGIGSDWNASASVGPITIASSSSTGTTEIGNVVVCETAEIIYPDSLTHAVATGPTPNMPKANHISRLFHVRPGQGFPGSFYPMKDEWAAIGQGRRQLVGIIGRTGCSTTLDGSKPFSSCKYGLIRTTGQTGIDDIRGVRFWFPDGLVSVNNTTGYATVTSPSTAESEAAADLADAETILQAIMDSGNEAWVWDHSYRTALTGWDADTQDYVDRINAGQLALIKANQSGGRIQYSPTGYAFSTDDNVHPANDESLGKSQAAISSISTPGGSRGYMDHISRGFAPAFSGMAWSDMGLHRY